MVLSRNSHKFKASQGDNGNDNSVEFFVEASIRAKDLYRDPHSVAKKYKKSQLKNFRELKIKGINSISLGVQRLILQKISF